MLPEAQLHALEEKEQADAPDSVRYRESALLGGLRLPAPTAADPTPSCA
jgi:hypothetical protein